MSSLLISNDTPEVRDMKRVAYCELNRRFRVLAPANEATVEFPDFNPFLPVQVVAFVRWPATVGMRQVVLTHAVMDGAAV